MLVKTNSSLHHRHNNPIILRTFIHNLIEIRTFMINSKHLFVNIQHTSQVNKLQTRGKLVKCLTEKKLMIKALDSLCVTYNRYILDLHEACSHYYS